MDHRETQTTPDRSAQGRRQRDSEVDSEVDADPEPTTRDLEDDEPPPSSRQATTEAATAHDVDPADTHNVSPAETEHAEDPNNTQNVDPAETPGLLPAETRDTELYPDSAEEERSDTEEGGDTKINPAEQTEGGIVENDDAHRQASDIAFAGAVENPAPAEVSAHMNISVQVQYAAGGDDDQRQAVEEEHEQGASLNEKYPTEEKDGSVAGQSEVEELREESDGVPGSAELVPSSPEQEDATATVKILLTPGGQVMTMATALSQTAGSLKEHFATEMKVPSQVILISFEGSTVDNTQSLRMLGVKPHGTVQLEMCSTEPDTYPLRPIKLRHEYSMPDVITVRVQTGSGTLEDVVVEIERATRQNPFLGGFRHRLTGTEFHHAGTQTLPKRRPDTGIKRFCRNTQTVSEKQHYQQTHNTTATQMTKIGCYITSTTDRLLAPRAYVTAKEYHERRRRAVIVLQSYLRRWLAKDAVQRLREAKALRLDWERQEEERRRQEKEERRRRDYERRVNPRSKEDFDLLYAAVEKWRKEEVARIDGELSGDERKAALCTLLEQETQLLASIGRHKLIADGVNREKAVRQLLQKSASPKCWKAFDGKTTAMHTPASLLAKELQDIYSSISMPSLSQEERLDALRTLKDKVKDNDCKLTREIAELVDRETDLLTRSIKEANLEGLRKRICTLFLQYIKTPAFNPAVAKLLKVPQDPTELRKNVYFCSGCRDHLPASEFWLASDSRGLGRCRRCCQVDNAARRREEMSEYRAMLRRLCHTEEGYSDGSRAPFLIQEQDLQFLVDRVWGAQSALSAFTGLAEMELVRWDKREAWSPWNCILLTRDEAKYHLQLEDIDKAYERAFVQRVEQRQALARGYFSRLPGMAQQLEFPPAPPPPGLKILRPRTTTASATGNAT
ncbi:IQ and ubiquitin-like domain-containing protein isoform X1 [Lethenteron reissneri]|uniref:IQ and ubiquitin-like domain-containing protein isoform X1 n=1 Tax=Lethenteron reissneri TaxID=7753 RepID=UPI002AB68BC0|nr:IQ and ubiquitin-like domain-containing protein isoform X1 [Lethenteron reissneri]